MASNQDSHEFSYVEKIPFKPDTMMFQLPFAMSIAGPTQRFLNIAFFGDVYQAISTTIVEIIELKIFMLDPIHNISSPKNVIFFSGKSEFIFRLLQNKDHLFPTHFHRLVYCIPETLMHENSFFERLRGVVPHVELCHGIPNIGKLQLDLDKLPCLVIIDDLMNEVLNSNKMVQLFAVQSHHFNISIIFTVQNFFAGSKYGKTIMRNVSYRVFFYNRLDLVELRNISTQLVPGYPNFLQSSFDFLIKEFPKERPYILVDGHIKSMFNRGMYIRSHVFPDADNIIRPITFSPNPNYSK